MWRNWSGLESATPARVEEPADTAAVVDAIEKARADGGTVKMVGTGHSFTAISAPEGTMLTPHRMSGIVAVDRDAMTVTALAGTPLKVLNAELERLGPEPAQHGRHRRADPRRRHLDRHPRHRRRRRRAGRAGRGPRAGHRHRRGAPRDTAEENADVLDVARVGLGRPRRAHHGHLPGGAAVPARGDRAADVVGRGARLLRRDGRGEPPRRHVLVPAHRPDAHQAQRPPRRRPRRGRAAPPLARLARRRLPVQHLLRRAHRRRQPGPGRRSRG